MTGILLIQLGTPDAPTYRGLFPYLRQFLSDRRVIEVPKAVWTPLLYGFILPFRSGAIGREVPPHLESRRTARP